jgi:exodeoxyribonuclease VII large subunit
VASSRARVELGAGRLHALSPLAILERGYSICRDARGLIVRDVAGVEVGELIEARLARGSLECRVEARKS